MEGVEAANPQLAHVHLVHGTKWYGCQMGPFPTPSREDDPRQLQPTFYYTQHDYNQNYGSQHCPQQFQFFCRSKAFLNWNCWAQCGIKKTAH